MKALILAALLLPAAASAQTADCALPDGWTKPDDVTAAAGSATLDAARLVPGHAAQVTLHPNHAVSYAVTPEKALPVGGEMQGGLLSVDIPAAGVWRVALGSGAWLDVLEDGKPVASSAHGHGCAGMRKIVSFVLKAGSHVLQISASPETRMAIAVMQ